MSLLSKSSIVTLVSFLVTLLLLPKFVSYLLSLVLRSIGWSIQKRTRARRKIILARVRAEEEELRSKQAKSSPRTSEDEDWEKVENSALGNADNGKPAEDEWEGIIGFFHPFWYGKSTFVCRKLSC